LRAEKLPNLPRTYCHFFQFQSRSKANCGIVEIKLVPSFSSDPKKIGIGIVVHGAVNPTGSPALYEHEPVDKDFSIEGYEKSE
jgi:hypothetical protein